MLFYFRVFTKTIEENLLKKTQKQKKNYSNHSSESNTQDYELDGVPLAEISEFVIYEVLLALISLVIVSTSSLVIYRIKKAKRKMLGLTLLLSVLVFPTLEWDSSVDQYRGLCTTIYEVHRKPRFSYLLLATFSIFFRTYFLAYSQQLLH